jgi:hypothetical protein
MADPRDTARQWLADVIWQGGLMHVMSPEDIADAILTAPGVEVCEEVPGFDVEPGQRVPMYRVVTIRLPIQPIGDGDG